MMQFVDAKGKKVFSTLLLTVFVFSSFLTVLQIDAGSPVEMAGLSDAVDQSAEEPMAFCGTPMYNDPEYLRTMVTYAETERVFTSVGEPMNVAPPASASGTVSAEISSSLSLASASPAEYHRHVMCKNVVDWNPVNPTTTFLPSDSYVYLLMTVTVNSQIRSVWYYRNDNLDNVWDYYGEATTPITTPETYDYRVRLQIAGNPTLPTLPRAWRIMVYLDGAHSFNEYFEITDDGWQSVTCEDIDANGEPVSIKDNFTIGVDPHVYYYLRLYHVAYYNEITDHCHDYLLLWYQPDGTLFGTMGPSGWSDYKNDGATYDYWGWVAVAGYMNLDSGTPTGQWRIETYIDTYYDGGEAWYLLTTTTFTVVKEGAEVFYYYEYNQFTGASTQKSVTPEYYGQTVDGNFEIYYDKDDLHIDATYLSYVADAAVNSWSQLVPFLGSPYDQDGDGLIEVLIVDLNKYDEIAYGGGVIGYVQSNDANGLGMIYLDNDIDVWLSWNELKHTFSHEFTHRVEFSYDPFEQGWLMEGVAQFGGDYAWPFSEFQGYVNTFQNNPDIDLTSDTYEAYYCAAYVFFEYVAEEFGTSAVRTVLERTSIDQGKQAVENAVGVSFDTLFNGFAVKNYANDYAGTAKTFEGIDIFAASIASHTVFPASGIDEINLWATDYVSFTSTEPSLKISFSGDPGRAHNVSVIKVVGDFVSYSVEDIPLTNNQGSIAISDANTYSQIALMTTRHEDAYPYATWNYSAEVFVPTPTVISPNGGEIWSGTQNITWTASTDPDGDPITYEIEYSYDGGGTWNPLASGISETSYSWNTTAHPDGSNYLIRVRAYDGVLYSDWDQSDSVFTIENRVPTIIDHAPTGTQVPVTTIISATFSEAMNQTSSENAFSISPMVSGLFTWSGDTMIFTPNLVLEYDTTYNVTITTEAEDLAGNNLESPFNWQFTTSAAPPPPPPRPSPGPSAPPRIDVNVQTLDWEGEVLGNAHVEIVEQDTSGLSDSNGWVNFTDVEPGTVMFNVYWMGVKVNETTTTLEVDSTITLTCHVWNLQLLTQDANNNPLASTTIYTTFPNGTTKPLSSSTYRVMNGTYWFSVKWQNNWVYGNSSINLDVATTSYIINCKVYQLSLSWRDYDGTWSFNPTSYKIIAPNGTISSITTSTINQAQNGTWEIHAVYWQENNVVPSTHLTHELASNYNWAIHSRIYQIAIGFKDADGNVISTPSTYTITFPNKTSKSLDTFAFRCQNGTILLTSITWQASEVCPSPNPTISITASQTYYVNLEVFNPTLNVLKPDGTTAFAKAKLDIRFPNGTIIKNIQIDASGQVILKVQKGTYYINVTTTDGHLAQANHEIFISATKTFDIPTIGLYAEVPVDGQIYPLLIKTNSTEVSNFAFDVEKREINFNISGTPGTVGACTINILKELVDSRSDIKVYIDGKKTDFTLTEDANNYYVYVEYQHSTHAIKINFAHSTPEAILQMIIESGWLILLATVIVAVAALLFARKKRISKIKQ